MYAPMQHFEVAQGEGQMDNQNAMHSLLYASHRMVFFVCQKSAHHKTIFNRKASISVNFVPPGGYLTASLVEFAAIQTLPSTLTSNVATAGRDHHSLLRNPTLRGESMLVNVDVAWQIFFYGHRLWTLVRARGPTSASTNRVSSLQPTSADVDQDDARGGLVLSELKADDLERLAQE